MRRTRQTHPHSNPQRRLARPVTERTPFFVGVDRNGNGAANGGDPVARGKTRTQIIAMIVVGAVAAAIALAALGLIIYGLVDHDRDTNSLQGQIDMLRTQVESLESTRDETKGLWLVGFLDSVMGGDPVWNGALWDDGPFWDEGTGIIQLGDFKRWSMLTWCLMNLNGTVDVIFQTFPGMAGCFPAYRVEPIENGRAYVETHCEGIVGGEFRLDYILNPEPGASVLGDPYCVLVLEGIPGPFDDTVNTTLPGYLQALV